jgi:hypothetical protein
LNTLCIGKPSRYCCWPFVQARPAPGVFRQFASPALFVYTLPNIVIGEICIRHHFQGENAFFIFEHFDANFIEQYVGNLVNNNILQACICGWVDCLGDGYKAALFLVEKIPGPQAMEFTAENILTIYHSDNG